MEEKLTNLIKKASELKGMRGGVMIKEIEMMAVAMSIISNSDEIEKLSKLTETSIEIQNDILDELKKLNNKPIEKGNNKPIEKKNSK